MVTILAGPLWEHCDVRTHAEWIEDLRIELRAKDNKTLSSMLNVDYEQLRNAVKGRSATGFQAIADSASKLLGRNWPDPELKIVQRVPLVRVPVVGSVSAGQGHDGESADDEVWIPSTMVPDSTVAWVARGDSMMPWIQPGETVLAIPRKEPLLGYAMLARRQDGEMAVKKIVWAGDRIMLRSLNKSYKDEPADVEWIGLVVGIYHSRGSYERSEADRNGLRPPEI